MGWVDRLAVFATMVPTIGQLATHSPYICKTQERITELCDS